MGRGVTGDLMRGMEQGPNQVASKDYLVALLDMVFDGPRAGESAAKV